MHIVILVVGMLALIVGPGLWVKAVIARYSHPANSYSQSGGEFARQLLDYLGLKRVTTEVTDTGDHYDPLAKAVRLSAANFDGHSLAAITIAAHEVGHAIQDAKGFKPLKCSRKHRCSQGVRKPEIRFLCVWNLSPQRNHRRLERVATYPIQDSQRA